MNGDGWLGLLRREGPALLGATAAHVELVAQAVLIATALAVPAGLAAAHRPRTERLAVAVANLLQTIPSLALLGFLLILFGGVIGKPPALTALVLYALLPILKTTVLGVRAIDPAVREAALGMGMTPAQRLRLVELPLALPAILSGVRIATVASVGMATVAAAIGARGLGSYIFRGVSLSDPRLILLGAVPAAVLALVADGLLGGLERALDPTRGPARGRTPLLVAAGFGIAVAAGGGALVRLGEPGRGDRIVIGSKDSAEPILLAHMLALLVEDRTGLPVERALNLGGTLVCYNALSRRGLDAYVEYTGTALATILKEPPGGDPEAVLRRVREGCARDGVTVLDPIGFENTFAILMRRDRAESLGIRRISDLRAHASTLRAGFGPEFMNRPDGYPGLVAAYGLDLAVAPREMDRNLLYGAVARGTLDVAAGDSTDGRVAGLDLVVLADDRRYFPPYQAVPLARAGALGRHPALRDALNALAGRIDAATMTALNRRVDGAKEDPAAVAKAFLVERGLLK
jgi:osmoprotectant transport system permease protein